MFYERVEGARLTPSGVKRFRGISTPRYIELLKEFGGSLQRSSINIELLTEFYGCAPIRKAGFRGHYESEVGHD